MKTKLIGLLIVMCIFLSGCGAVNLYVIKKEHLFMINAGDKIVRDDGTEEIIESDGVFLDNNTAKHVFKARFR